MAQRHFAPSVVWQIHQFSSVSSSKSTLGSNYIIEDIIVAVVFAVVTGADMREEWIQKHKPVSRQFTIIVVSTIIAVGLIFTLAFLVAFGSNFYKGKKRDAY